MKNGCVKNIGAFFFCDLQLIFLINYMKMYKKDKIRTFLNTIFGTKKREYSIIDFFPKAL